MEVDIEGAEVGTQVYVKDLKVPQGSTILADEDTLVVNVTHAPTAEEVEAELESAEAEAGIEREEAEVTEAEAPEGGEATEGAEGEGDSAE